MPTDAVIDDLVDNHIMTGLDRNYRQGEKPALDTMGNLDPFGIISTVPDSPIGDYDFSQLTAEQGQAFFEKINMAKRHDDPPRTMPDAGELAPDQLDERALSNGIPPLQHSVWVGNPLNAEVPKQKAFMDSLAKNKRDNPGWTVVLWTDQSRDALNNAPRDSNLGKMRQWAAENNVVLASIDEVFGGANKMGAHEICKMEQNKLGSGRAAASDIVRLEVLNRFGGLYVDGDKALKTSLDNISQKASTNVMRITVPQDKVGSHPVLEPKTDAEKEAVKNGMRVVEVRGFAAGNEGGNYQNCAMMAPRGNLATQRILDRIHENYKMDRHTLVNPFNKVRVDELDRPSRVEVITRTGPTVMRDTVDAEKRGVALMPPDSINTYTGTTSWTGEKTFTGKGDMEKLTGKLGDFPAPHTLHRQATLAATEPPVLPQMDAISDDSRTRVVNAVKKCVTSLSYTIPNEMGRLDMNHIKPHIANLTPEEQQLVMHATLKTLAQDELAGVGEMVTTVRLPQGIPVSRETLDFLAGDSFENLRLSGYTVQEAALEGNMQFLRYAKDNGMLDDLSVQTTQRLDVGGTETGPKGKLDVVQAAIAGGHTNAIQYLSSLPSFKTYPKIDEALQQAAAYGQMDTVISLAEAHNKPEAIHLLLAHEKFSGKMGVEMLERFRSTFGPQETFKEASGLLLLKAVQNGATDSIPRLRELGVDMAHLDDEQKQTLVFAIQNCASDGPKAATLLQVADDLGLEPEVLQAGIKSSNDRITGPLLNKHATDGPKCTQLLDEATRLGTENKLLQAAGRLGNADIITAALNKKRDVGDQIAFGEYDHQAQLAIAHTKIPNSEVGKNDYKNVEVNKLNPQEARELVQKAMVYSHDRLRADATGDKGRAQGWDNLLESMKDAPGLKDDVTLQKMIGETQNQLHGMNNKTVSVRDEMRRQAKEVDSPDLSQRQATSKAGKLREFFKATPAPEKSPEGHQFVPSKGMVKK